MRVLALIATLAIASQGVAAGKASASTQTSSSSGLLTVSAAYDFGYNSACLWYNLVCFTGFGAFNAGWQFVPKDLQKTGVEKYDQGMKALNTLRVQYGLPTLTDLVKDVKSEWNKKVMPLVNKAISTANTLAAPAQSFVGKIVPKFEDEYPETAGMVPNNVFDLLLTLFFLYVFVWGYLVQPVLNCFCCGACSKRKAAAAQPKTASGRPIIKNKKKNN